MRTHTFILGVLAILVLTVPIANAATQSFSAGALNDGAVGSSTAAAFPTVHAASGNYFVNGTYNNYARITGGTISATYTIERGVIRFDTSALPDTCTVTGVKLAVIGNAKTNGLGSFAYGVTGFTATTSDGTFVAADYQQKGATRYATDIPYASLSNTSWNNWTGNSYFINAINKTGCTNVMIRNQPDIDYSATGITWSSGGYSAFSYQDVGFGTAPLLEVTYTVAEGEDPYADYVPESISGSAPLTVQFTDLSYNNPTSWMWNYTDVTGAGVPVTFSIVQNPQYTFSTGGNFSIQLYTSNAYGSNLSTANVAFVNVTGAGSPPIANFTTANWTVYNGVATQFNDTSTGSPTSWEWRTGPYDVGVDSAPKSTEQNPLLTFYSGTYDYWTIQLTVTNSAGSDTVMKYIHTIPTPGAPVANFTPLGEHVEGNYYNIITVVNNTAVTFNDTSTGSPTSWNWTFQYYGGGVFYRSEQNPTVTFNSTLFALEYLNRVRLTATNAGGASEIFRDIKVVNPPTKPIMQFYVYNDLTSETHTNVQDGYAGNITIRNGDTLYFTDTSYNLPTSRTLLLNAGNGTSYTYYPTAGGTASLKYTDAVAGYYPITYTGSNDAGTSTFTLTSFLRVIDTAPPASVSGITNQTGVTALQFNWTNPTTSDFSYTMTWRDGVFIGNVSTNGTYWSGLNSNTSYSIATKTVDELGNVNGTFVNSTATTGNGTWVWGTCGTTYLVVPLDVTSVSLNMYGGGGSGRSATNSGLFEGNMTYLAGDGGHRGSQYSGSNIAVTPGANYTIVVGCGAPNATVINNATYGSVAYSGNASTAFGFTAAGGLPGTSLGGTNGGNGENGVGSTRLAFNGTNSSTYSGGISGLGNAAAGGGGAAANTLGSYHGGGGAPGIVYITASGFTSGLNIPDFVADITESGPGSLIHFSDLSTIVDTANLTYNWSFGDGEYSSTSGNTQHVYAYNGIYDVSLTLSTDTGDVTETKVEYITIYNKGTTISTYSPWMVRLRVVDAFGVPLPGANITVTYIASSLPSSDATFLSQAFNVDLSVANQMIGGDLAMSGTTTDDGSVTFLMFPVLSYGLTITNSTAGLNNYRVLSPKSDDYIIRCPLSDQHAPNDTLQQVVNSRNAFYRLNSSYYNLSTVFQDSSGNTINLRFQVYDYSAGNVLVYDHDLGNPGTGIVTDNYTVYLPLGAEYRWGYNSTKI